MFRSLVDMSASSENWSCEKCSFSNHPDLSFCEICEGQRTVMSHNNAAVASSSTGLVFSNKEPTVVNNWTVEKTGFQMDDCSCTSGILELMDALFVKEKISYVLTWPHCSHFSQRNSFGASWSCGYRNVQMISSALMQIPEYREKLYSGKGRMPNIRIIQQWIEEAWKEGFDPEGRSHFNGKLVGTKEWIGTTECCVLLRYFGVRAKIVDFHPDLYETKKRKVETQSFEIASAAGEKNYATAADSLIHSHIGVWLKEYFQDSSHGMNGASSGAIDSYFSSSSSGGAKAAISQNRRFLPPLYFQHDGHSRTIVGVTVEGGVVDALVLDPACSGQLIVKSLKESIDSVRVGVKKWQRQLRRPMERFTKSEYQILYIEEGFMSKEERERSKTMDSVSFSNQFYS